MKKKNLLLIFCVASMVSLSACGSDKNINSKDENSETVTEAVQEENTTAAKSILNEGGMVYKDENITITYIGIDNKEYLDDDERKNYYNIRFSFDNLSDKTFYIEDKNIVINGESANPSWKGYMIPAQEKKELIAIIGEEDADKFPMDSIENIKTQFEIGWEYILPGDTVELVDSYVTEEILIE